MQFLVSRGSVKIEGCSAAILSQSAGEASNTQGQRLCVSDDGRLSALLDSGSLNGLSEMEESINAVVASTFVLNWEKMAMKS